MGIRFTCPNGHKLNVKSFLAGKRGVCPQCGTSVRIPDESQADDNDDSDSDEPKLPVIPTSGPASAGPSSTTIPVGPAPAAPIGRPSVLPSVPPGPVPAVVPASAAPAFPPAPIPGPALPSAVPGGLPSGAVPVSPPSFAPAIPAAMPAMANLPAMPMGVTSVVPAPPPPAGPPDPIAEAPNAQWYVRPPSGGQYGPARGDVFRKWLTEGRVNAESLVWRDGWPDWRPAGPLFPQLGGRRPPPPPEPATSRSTAPRDVGRKRRGKFPVAWIVVLGVLSVILMVVLVLVINGT